MIYEMISLIMKPQFHMMMQVDLVVVDEGAGGSGDCGWGMDLESDSGVVLIYRKLHFVRLCSYLHVVKQS